jgi:hypothetical protein
MEMDLAVNSEEEMEKSREQNVKNVFCINVHIVHTVHPYECYSVTVPRVLSVCNLWNTG